MNAFTNNNNDMRLMFLFFSVFQKYFKVQKARQSLMKIKTNKSAVRIIIKKTLFLLLISIIFLFVLFLFSHRTE